MDNWRSEHAEEELKVKQGDQQRSSDKLCTMDTSEDTAIDLSSTAKQEKRSTLRQCLSRDLRTEKQDNDH